MRVVTDPYLLKPCDNPHCERLVRKGTLYCCTPCSFAAETQAEIDGHSEGCQERHAIRSDPANRRIGVPFDTEEARP